MIIRKRTLFCVGIILALAISIGTANAAITVDSLTKLTDNSGNDVGPDWGPNDNKLIYMESITNDWTDSKIIEMNSDGTDKDEVIPKTAWFAKYSPDGTKIAYASYPSDGSLSVKDLNTGSVDLLVSGDGIYEGVVPDWSPDGKKIVYSRYKRSDKLGQIWIYDLESKTNTKISTGDTDERYPSWSPDGKYISYVKEGHDIWMMNYQDGTKTPITNTPSSNKGRQSWSPDSSMIAFTSDKYGNNDIFIINIDGSGETRLTTNSSSDAHPDWSHEGDKIAFSSNRGGNHDIWVMTLSGYEEQNPVEKYALIIGIDEYPNAADLEWSNNNADLMNGFLQQMNDFKENNILMLTDDRANRNNIISEIRNFRDSMDDNDIFVFYFAGHGGRAEANGEEYILAYDYNKLGQYPYGQISSGVLKFEFNQFKKGTIVAIFDCCNSGGMAYSTDINNPIGSKTGIMKDNCIVLMSCEADKAQSQWSGPLKRRYTFFTESLVEGFTNGKSSIEEAFEYADDLTQKKSKDAFGVYIIQKPQMMDSYKSDNDNAAQFYLSDDESQKLEVIANCPVNLHLYDSEGKHVGLNASGVDIDNEIFGVFYNGPDSEPEKIIVMGQNDNFRFEIEALDEGEFDFTIIKDEGTKSVNITYIDVQITKNTRAYVDVASENPAFLMQIDTDGNGVVDEIRKPDSTSNDETPVPPTNEVPEFPTIALPVAAILGLALLFQRKNQ